MEQISVHIITRPLHIFKWGVWLCETNSTYHYRHLFCMFVLTPVVHLFRSLGKCLERSPYLFPRLRRHYQRLAIQQYSVTLMRDRSTSYSGLPLIQSPLGPVKVSWLEGWPHFRGEFAVGKTFWSGHNTGVASFQGSRLKGVHCTYMLYRKGCVCMLCRLTVCWSHCWYGRRKTWSGRSTGASVLLLARR